MVWGLLVVKLKLNLIIVSRAGVATLPWEKGNLFMSICLIRLFALLSICIFCTPTITSAATFRNLGEPCRPFNILSARHLQDPQTGRDVIVLGNTNESSGLELLFLDPVANTMKVVIAPAGQGAWLMRPISDNRLVIGTYYDGKWLVYDMNKGAFVKVVPVPGEQYIWHSAIGKDGRVYGGTYPGAVLAALDLDTYEVQSYPYTLPGKHQYLRYVNATADGRLICTYDTADATNMIFDPATEKFTSAPASLKPLTRSVLWEGYLCSTDAVYDGTTLEPIDPPPFPVPSGTGWTMDYNLTTSDTLYLRQKNTVYSYKKGDDDLKKIATWDSKIGGSTRGVLPNGDLVCSIGQDYFIVSDDITSVTLQPLPRPDYSYAADGKTTTLSAGRPSHFIAADGQGKLWGGPLFGQTLWVMDLDTGKTTNTSIVSTRGGEVYDVAFANDKVYAVAYVGGEIIEYDPAKPFDLFYGNNPHTIANMKGDYIRPSAGIELGKDGLLYSGYLAKYGTYGGAVSITDPKNPKDHRIIENPLGPQGISGIEVDDKYIYIGTTLKGNGLPNNPEGTAQLGVIDKATTKTIWKTAFEGIGTISNFYLDDKTGMLAINVSGKLALFDTNARKLIEPEKALPIAENITGNSDGLIYFGSGKDLIVYDLAAGKIQEKIKTPIEAQKVTYDSTTGKLYISSGPDVVEVEL